MITEKNKYNVMTGSNSAILNLLRIGNYLNIKIKDHYPPTGDQIVAFLSFVFNTRNLPVHIHCLADKGCSSHMEAVSDCSTETTKIYNTNVG